MAFVLYYLLVYAFLQGVASFLPKETGLRDQPWFAVLALVLLLAPALWLQVRYRRPACKHEELRFLEPLAPSWTNLWGYWRNERWYCPKCEEPVYRKGEK